MKTQHADLPSLEKEVLSWLLRGDEPVLRSLRQQLSLAVILSRELTGVGFYLNFGVPTGSDSIVGASGIKPSFWFGDVNAQIATLRSGAGFILWITNGKLDFLEGYTYGEDWPTQTTPFKLNYIGGNRDWDSLRKQWQSSDQHLQRSS